LLAFNLQFGPQSDCLAEDSQRFFGLFGPGFGLGWQLCLLLPHGGPELTGPDPLYGSAKFIYILINNMFSCYDHKLKVKCGIYQNNSFMVKILFDEKEINIKCSAITNS
jgi:hypothetical protein